MWGTLGLVAHAENERGDARVRAGNEQQDKSCVLCRACVVRVCPLWTRRVLITHDDPIYTAQHWEWMDIQRKWVSVLVPQNTKGNTCMPV